MSKTVEKPIESKEAEQAVIGTLLIRSENFAEVIDKIHSEDFYHLNHQTIFQAMMELDEANSPIDYNSVRIRLQETGNLEKAGGMVYLVSLNDEVGSSANLFHFVDIVYQKSTMRRFAAIMAKAYQSAFNGNRIEELITKTREKLADLSAGAGVRLGGVTGQVREWIKLAPGYFEVRQIYNDLGTVSTKDKKLVLMALNKAEKDGLIEKLPGAKRGQYRIVEEKADKIDFLKADSSNWLNITLPLDIHKYVRLFPSNIVVIAGEKGSGKTAFCLDTARLNLGRFKLRYLSSEMAAEELRDRLEKFGLPIEVWKEVDFRSRRDNFADLIDPDAINFIDFLEKYDQFWTIASDIRGVFDKLQKGICIIAIQKDTGTESGRGGMFTREKCRLHVALNKKNEAKIDDVKVFAMPGYNPNGLVLKYKLVQGARLILSDADSGDGKYGAENW